MYTPTISRYLPWSCMNMPCSEAQRLNFNDSRVLSSLAFQARGAFRSRECLVQAQYLVGVVVV